MNLADIVDLQIYPSARSFLIGVKVRTDMETHKLKFGHIQKWSTWFAATFAISASAQVTTIIVPFAVGGPTDASARMVASALGKDTGASYIVENVPGAGATVGATKAAQAKPDGYTLLWGSGSSLAITPHLYSSLRYDPVKSFAPIGLVVAQPFVLVVRPASGIRSVKDLVIASKAAPGKMNFSSTGQGASSHLVAELFMSAAGIKATHVPYNGGAPGVNAVLSGDVDFFFDTPTTTVPLVKGGKLLALAVTGTKRWPGLPDIPTLQEVGFADFDATTWFGLVAPAGTPRDRVATLSQSLVRVLNDPATATGLRTAGFSVEPSSPDEFAKRILSDSARWGAVIKAANIKLD